MANIMIRTPDGEQKISVMLRATGTDLPVDVFVSGVVDAPDVPAPMVDHVANFLSGRPFYVAHRLGGHDYPEHTMEGLRASLAAGYKAVEFSTYITSDGVFVGSHDWTTERTTGEYHEIWNTPWSTIQGLNQSGGKIIRLQDMISALPDDVVVFIDHKGTSSKAEPSADGLRSENLLFDQLDELFDDPTKRVVWKCFAEASSSERAKARGYRVNCMLYPNTMAGADFNRWDILGMEWSAPQSAWQQLTAVGKPTIGHIIYNQDQANTALVRGATGLMVSVPSLVRP